ncbi:helix-turn-helix domain-containing protein [uncultured Corynebacterium sp.]|uniref:helix-turn-helix domain-containing protein n=1 Tax=uncultured Corynebacterium sp. TaxID=159447 RepID=UPI002599FD90|nr:helix-turn-helix domain-containing protein [uncultured Corynebacterium sp.]
MINIKKDAYTPGQLSEALNVSPSTLSTWRNRGKGPKFFRLVGHVYYAKTDVEEWLKEQIERG